MNNSDVKHGLQRITFVESARFEHIDLDISRSTLLLGDSGVGKTSIMRAVLFFYTMDYSPYILGTGNDESKKEFAEWYFDQRGSSHIIYSYQTYNGKFLFVVSRHGKLKYTFIDVTDYEGDIENILIDKDSMPVATDQLDVYLSVLGLRHYSTLKIEEYRRVFIKSEYPKLGSKFVQTQLESVKYYLYKDMSDAKIYGKYLSKIFLNNKVSESSIKEIFASLVSIDSDSKGDYTSSIVISDIQTRLEKIQQFENDYNRFTSRLKSIKLANELITLYSNEKEKLKEMKEELALVLENQDKVTEYFMEKILYAKDELDEFSTEEKIKKKYFGSKIETLGANMLSSKNSIERIERLKKKYSNMNIEFLISEANKEDTYKKELRVSEQNLTLLTADKKNLKNLAKEQELKAKDDIAQKYLQLENEFQLLNNDCEQKIEDLMQKQSKEETSLAPLKKNIDELKAKLAQKSIEIVTISKDIELCTQKAITNEQIESLNHELRTQKENEHNKIDKQNSLTKQMQKIEDERKEISSNYSRDKDKIENEYNLKSQKIEDKIFHLKDKKANLLDYDKNTLFGKLNSDNDSHRDVILNIVKDEVLHDENINITKKDKSDTLYGYEISMPFKSYENIIEKISEEISEANTILSTIRGQYKRMLSALDKNTKAEQKKKADMLKKLVTEQAENNFKLSSIKNKISQYETKIPQEREKEIKAREYRISEMRKQLKAIEIEKSMREKEITSNEESLNAQIKSIFEKYSSHILQEKQKKSEYKSKQASNKGHKDKETSKRVKEVWDNYNKILEEEGVDGEKLQELQTNIEAAKKSLSEIDINRNVVWVYKDNDKKEIEKLPNIEEHILKNQETKKALEEKRDTEIDYLSKKITEISNAVAKAEDNKKRIKDYFKELTESCEILNLNKVFLSEKYFSSSDVEFINADIEQFIKGISNTKVLSYRIKDIESEIAKKTVEVTKGFKEENALNVPVLNDSISTTFEYIQVLKTYINRMDNKTHEHGKGESLKLTSETIAYLKNSLDNMRLKIEKIEDLKVKTNKTIVESIKNIAVLDFLKIELEEDKTNPIIEKIDEIIEYADRNSHIYIGGIIQDKDQVVHESINRKISKLQHEIETYRRSDISVNDLFTIYFRISENGTDLGKITSLNQVGSNGTGIMARSIIYISLLYNNSLKTRVSENQMFHCIIDEIGQISENYFEELMSFAESKGFSFLNGIPVMVEGMIALYPSVYTGYTENGHSVMLNTTKEFIDVDEI